LDHITRNRVRCCGRDNRAGAGLLSPEPMDRCGGLPVGLRRRTQGAQLPALLTRMFRHAQTGPSAGLVAYGPHYAISGGRLAIDSGPLAGTALRVERSMTDTRADFSLFQIADGSSPISPDPVAHCHFDRDAETGLETLLSVFIRSEYRHRGLTTLLVRLSFRELLHAGKLHWFAIRKLMQVDSEARNQAQTPGTPKPESAPLSRISLHNIGIGMVALRLGFRPEPNLERLLAPGNVRAVQAIPPDPTNPPGLLVRLGTLPALLVAALIDPQTGRPLADADVYQRFVNPKQLLRQALAGEAVLGNIDYILSRAAIEPLAARLANDQAELKRFAAALHRGAQN